MRRYSTVLLRRYGLSQEWQTSCNYFNWLISYPDLNIFKLLKWLVLLISFRLLLIKTSKLKRHSLLNIIWITNSTLPKCFRKYKRNLLPKMITRLLSKFLKDMRFWYLKIYLLKSKERGRNLFFIHSSILERIGGSNNNCASPKISNAIVLITSFSEMLRFYLRPAVEMDLEKKLTHIFCAKK